MFSCKQCGYKSKYNSRLQQHTKQVHLKIKDFECESCYAKFSQICDLQRHIKQVHVRIRDFKCNLCEYTCSVKCDLKKHIKICTGKLHMSSMEFQMKKVLDEFNYEYLYNSNHNNLKGSNGYLRFDFILPTNDESYIMIEMNGIQHYKPATFGGISKEQAQSNYEKQLLHDAIKKKYCKDNDYSFLVVKYNDMRDYTTILQEFLASI